MFDTIGNSMKFTQSIILTLLCVFFSASHQKKETISGYEVALKMFATAPSINTLSYTITKQERIDGKMLKQISYTKMIREPLQVYLRQQYPKNGMEVLYVDGTNNNKALINPNGFPWVNLNLDPRDGLMRNDQHHTLFQSGFDHVISILMFLCDKYESQIDSMVVHNGMVVWNERTCHSITFTNPNYEYIDYVVQENETIETIANKYKLNQYMMLELNPTIDEFDDISTNDIIRIPNDYSTKMNLYIDEEFSIPIRMEIFDGKGLYELYEYADVVINQAIPSEDFTKGNKKYDF
jgi:outer membrane lipoprotein-sorting protein